MGSPSLVADRVAEHADARDLDLDDVARHEPTRRLEARAGAGRRAGGDHIPGLQFGPSRDIGDERFEREDQALRRVVLTDFAVDASDDAQIIVALELVGGCEPWPDRAA